MNDVMNPVSLGLGVTQLLKAIEKARKEGNINLAEMLELELSKHTGEPSPRSQVGTFSGLTLPRQEIGPPTGLAAPPMVASKPTGLTPPSPVVAPVGNAQEFAPVAPQVDAPVMAEPSASPVKVAGPSHKGRYIAGALGLGAIMAGALFGGKEGGVAVASGIASGVDEAKTDMEKQSLLRQKAKKEKDAAARSVLKTCLDFLKDGDVTSAVMLFKSFTVKEPDAFSPEETALFGKKVQEAALTHQKKTEHDEYVQGLEVTAKEEKLIAEKYKISPDEGGQEQLRIARNRFKRENPQDEENGQNGKRVFDYLNEVIHPRYNTEKKKAFEAQTKEQDEANQRKVTLANSRQAGEKNTLEIAKMKEMEEMLKDAPPAVQKKAKIYSTYIANIEESLKDPKFMIEESKFTPELTAEQNGLLKKGANAREGQRKLLEPYMSEAPKKETISQADLDALVKDRVTRLKEDPVTAEGVVRDMMKKRGVEIQ